MGLDYTQKPKEKNKEKKNERPNYKEGRARVGAIADEDGGIVCFMVFVFVFFFPSKGLLITISFKENCKLIKWLMWHVLNALDYLNGQDFMKCG